MFNKAKTLDAKTKVGDMRTESGVKDTHQLFFLETLFASYKGKRGKEKKQAALDEAVHSLPEFITNPLLRIRGKYCRFHCHINLLTEVTVSPRPRSKS